MMEIKRSDEYTKLLQEIKNSFISAADIAIRLFEQGKRDGLPNHIIRQDIETALDGIVKERRLREILPLELKRSYTINSAIGAELGLDTKEDAELIAIIAQVRKEQAGKIFYSNYDRVSNEVFAVHDKISVTYIPELCEALHRENPRWGADRIKNQVASELLVDYPGIVHNKHLLEWTIQSKTRKLSKEGPKH